MFPELEQVSQVKFVLPTNDLDSPEFRPSRCPHCRHFYHTSDIELLSIGSENEDELLQFGAGDDR